MIENVIDRFLDEYLGNEVKSFSTNGWVRIYSVKNKSLILEYKYGTKKHKDSFILFGGNRLIKTISVFFNITEKESSQYLRNWFGENFNIDKMSDLLKFNENK